MWNRFDNLILIRMQRNSVARNLSQIRKLQRGQIQVPLTSLRVILNCWEREGQFSLRVETAKSTTPQWRVTQHIQKCLGSIHCP